MLVLVMLMVIAVTTLLVLVVHYHTSALKCPGDADQTFIAKLSLYNLGGAATRNKHRLL
jgi:hypothetical protein